MVLSSVFFLLGGLTGESLWFIPIGLASGVFGLACAFWGSRLIIGRPRRNGRLMSPWTGLILFLIIMLSPVAQLIAMPLKWFGLEEYVALELGLLAAVTAAGIFVVRIIPERKPGKDA